MIDCSNLKSGQKFYLVEWFDTFSKIPPFDPPKTRTLVYHKTVNGHLIECIDDTGRCLHCAYSYLSDWYSTTPKEAWERFVKDIEQGIDVTNNEVEKQQNLLDELIRQKGLANRKVGEFDASKDVAEISK